MGKSLRILHAARTLVLVCALAACASSGTREALDHAQGLSASGRLVEAHESLQQATARSPRDGELQAALLATRQRLATSLAGQAAEAMDKQRWDDAERAYRQLAALPGYDRQGATGLAQLGERRQAAKTPANPATVRSYEGFDVRVDGGSAKPATAPRPPVAASAPAADAEPTLEQALDRRVTLQFRDASVRSLFDVIGKTSGLNIIFDRDVSPDLKTTVFLKNTTVRAALDKIVLTSQLAWRALDDNTLLVYTDDPTKQRDYQALTVRSFLLANADAKLVASSLKTVLRFKDVVVDPKLNMIVLRDTPEAIRLAEKLVAMHDVPEPEVMLEIEILEITRSLIKDLGIEWPSSLSLAPLGQPKADGTAGQLTLNDLLNLNSNRVGATVGALTIKAGKNDSNINLLANPRIRAKNREKAKILIGERVAVVGTTQNPTGGFVSENVTYLDVGVKLEAEPQIFPGDEVSIKLTLEISNIKDQTTTKSGSTAPNLTTRTASTVLRLHDGENQILAGLIQDSDRSQGQKVPGLGDIPLLGRLFGSQHDEKQKTEVVLSITPRLIRRIAQPGPGAAGFDAGTASSVRGRRPDEGQGGTGFMPDNMGQPPSNGAPQQDPRSSMGADAARRQQDREEE